MYSLFLDLLDSLICCVIVFCLYCWLLIVVLICLLLGLLIVSFVVVVLCLVLLIFSCHDYCVCVGISCFLPVGLLVFDTMVGWLFIVYFVYI